MDGPKKKGQLMQGKKLQIRMTFPACQSKFYRLQCPLNENECKGGAKMLSINSAILTVETGVPVLYCA